MTPIASTAIASWVRIIPSPDNTSVLIQAAATASTGPRFATDPVTPPATAAIEIDGGTAHAGPSSAADRGRRPGRLSDP